ncbi:MAG: helix-turn-helix domain-containing protein [Gammaproteobacteria bacterium]|nr:helix-turn-helix domain-containing protein [Gammaproteobacteria bacterium]
MNRTAKLDAAARSKWVLALEVGAFKKSLLHTLAIRANGETFECWPSKKTLARESGMSVREVHDLIGELEIEGLITVVRSAGRHANRYTVNFQLNPAQRSSLNAARPSVLRRPNRAHGAGERGTSRHPTLHDVPTEQVKEQVNEQASPTEQVASAPPAPSIWDAWVAFAGEKSRSVLGRLIREYGEGAVMEAVRIVEEKRPADPVAYLKGVLRNRAESSHPFIRDML